jgi:hypothetical protein
LVDDIAEGHRSADIPGPVPDTLARGVVLGRPPTDRVLRKVLEAGVRRILTAVA